MFGRKKKVDTAEKAVPTEAEKKERRTRNFIMMGLALGLLLASLDGTVVGTSLPRIVGELGGMSLFAWLTTAYLLSETVTIPIAGKMSDRYGRKPVFLAGMGLFMAGSILAGMSNSMEMLIACRFLQGFGGGALMPVSMATVADLYAPTERGKVQGLLGGVFAIASIIGPFIGGYIVDHMSWRWVFYVNVPVGVLAVLITTMRFPNQSRDVTKRLDMLGMMTLITALAPFLLVLSWGGNEYAWDSVEIIGLSVLSIAATVAFVLCERRAEDPILPLHLFREKVLTLGSAGLFIIAIGLFGVISFLPIFLQSVIGMSATNSGETLIPLMMGAMAVSIVSGFLLKRTGYKVWLVAGPPVAALGLYLLSTLHSGSSASDAVIYLIIIGAGLGAVMSNFIVAAQNVVSKKEMGVATSFMSLFRGLGGTIGVTVLGSIVNRQMVVELNNNLPAGASAILPSTNVNTLYQLLMDPQLAAGIPSPIIDAIRLSMSNSLTHMFFIGAIIVLVAVVISLLIKNVPLKSVDEYHEREGVTAVPSTASEAQSIEALEAAKAVEAPKKLG
jgi:EmrB/QacA subfamily drug resistance transporter